MYKFPYLFLNRSAPDALLKKNGRIGIHKIIKNPFVSSRIEVLHSTHKT